uniref:Putative strictosidine beta-D-glucosidase n=1 Tax=Davidia involucrata TaxID=16924 RepID=A0A5B7ATG9_DAVIN
MRHNVGPRLPHFTPAESKKLKGSYDFIGVNYYTSRYAKDNQDGPPHHGHQGHGHPPSPPSYNTDIKVTQSTKRPDSPDGVLIGPVAAPTWLNIYPDGIYKLLVKIQNKYGNPLVYVTENGVAEDNDNKLTVPKALVDETRKRYLDLHLRSLLDAIRKGANVKGYFYWSFLDTFEWADGYTLRFGMVYIDYKNNLARYPKESAIWFMNFLGKSKKRPLDYKEPDNVVIKK